jgi:glutamate synthase (NADPH/NADH) small chain
MYNQGLTTSHITRRKDFVDTGLLDNLGIAYDPRGNVNTDKSYKTSVDKVFAAGDMRRGQSLVVHAIADGRKLAKDIDKYLMGESYLRSSLG